EFLRLLLGKARPPRKEIGQVEDHSFIHSKLHRIFFQMEFFLGFSSEKPALPEKKSSKQIIR
ncbi:MAG: hypothetical protein SOV73_07250, partial [Candidatus Faecivivens sp.]|nr:hypothetical protein [Candidatus Faecivivens sp.]